MAKRNQWQLVAYFDCKDMKGVARVVSASRKGSSWRIEWYDPDRHLPHSHIVHPSNAGVGGGLEREIALCFHMTDIKRQPPR